MTDARERFLREIADRLPPERIEEVHLFPPLRQGGVESGIGSMPEDEVANQLRGERRQQDAVAVVRRRVEQTGDGARRAQHWEIVRPSWP